jgi:hypothetical protein
VSSRSSRAFVTGLSPSDSLASFTYPWPRSGDRGRAAEMQATTATTARTHAVRGRPSKIPTIQANTCGGRGAGRKTLHQPTVIGSAALSMSACARRRCPIWWRAALVAAFAILAASRSAEAQETLAVDTPPVTLEWKANPECSDAPHVLSQVARILGEGSGARRQVTVRAGLGVKEGGAWLVNLVVEADGASRQRNFEAESCQAVVDAVALILAIAIDPQVAMRVVASVAEPAVPTVPAVAPATAPATATPPAPVTAPPRPTPTSTPTSRTTGRLPLDFVVGASFAADAGSLPSVGAGLNLALGAQVGSLRFELDGSYWGPQTADATPPPGGAKFQLGSGNARAAYLWSLGDFSLGPLLDVGLEGMSAQGQNGTQHNLTPTVFWASLGAGGLFTYRPVAPFALRLVLEGEFPLPHPSFIVQDPGSKVQVYTVSQVVARALVGAEIKFH